jgi:hypothetical protein
LAQGKGYRRAAFEAAWEAYCPGPNPPFGPSTDILPSTRPLGDEMGTTRTFSAVHDTSPVAPVDGKKAPTCSTSMGKWTDGRERKGAEAAKGDFDRGLCAQCRGEEGATPTLHSGPGYPPEGVWLHRECVRFWSPKAPAAPRAKVESASNGHSDPWADLDLPDYLRRT